MVKHCMDEGLLIFFSAPLFFFQPSCQASWRAGLQFFSALPCFSKFPNFWGVAYYSVKYVRKRAKCLALARSAKAKHEVSDPLGF